MCRVDDGTNPKSEETFGNLLRQADAAFIAGDADRATALIEAIYSTIDERAAISRIVELPARRT